MSNLNFTVNQKIFFIIALLSAIYSTSNAQSNLKLGNNPGQINSSAAFEIESKTKGLLLPRMSEGSRDSIASPATGLMVFNTTSNCINYYFGGWKSQCNADDLGAWGLLGNTSSNTTTNFLGTKNNVGLAIRTNDVERIRVSETGDVGIGINAPKNRLHVVATANPLRLVGVQNGLSADKVVTIDTAGVIRQRTVADIMATGNAWLNGGNALAAPGTLGTSTAQPWSIITNGTTRLTFDSNGTITQAASGAQVTLTGNVDATNGLDVTGAALTANAGATLAGTTNINSAAAAVTNIGTTAGTNNIAGTTVVTGITNLNTTGSTSTNIGNASSTTTVTGPTNINTTGTSTTAIGTASGTTNVLGTTTLTGTNNAVGTNNLNTTGSGTTNIGNTSATNNVIGTNNLNTSGSGITNIGNASATNNVIGTNNLNTSGAGITNMGNASATNNVLGTNNLNTSGAGTTNIGNTSGITNVDGSNLNIPNLPVTTTPTTDQVVVVDATTGETKKVSMANLVSADNGLTKTLNNVQLGGALTKATDIVTTATNTLAISGLQTAVVTDNIVTSDATTGVLKKSTPAAFIQNNAWGLLGNANTDSSANFVGTTDSKNLTFRTNNIIRTTITSAGDVGIGVVAPNSSLQVVGSVANTIRTITFASSVAQKTVSAADYTVILNASAGAITIDLPNPTTCTGRSYIIKKMDGVGTVTFDESLVLDLVSSFTTLTMASTYTIQSDGTQWLIVNRF